MCIRDSSINNKVLVADHDGEITEHTYSSGSANISDSLEGKQADSNLNTAQETDGDDCDETDVDGCTAQDAIAVCQTDADVTGGKFHLTGTASCYTGKTFTFEGLLPEAGADGVTVPKSNLIITERLSLIHI